MVDTYLDLAEVTEKQTKKLSILYEVALTVGKSLNLKSILDNVLEKVVGFMEVDAGIIYIINEETLEMIPVSFSNLSDDIVKEVSENLVKVGECLCGTIAQFEKEIIIREGASHDPRFVEGVLKQKGVEFYAGLPLKAKGKITGVLCVFNFTHFEPDDDLIDTLRAATVPIGLAIENARLFEDLKKDAEPQLKYENFSTIIGNSPGMKEVIKLAQKLANITSSILIYGESGTGKELIAKGIHYSGAKKNKPFVAVNCAAIPESLLESELFGYVKGAFTGASANKKGLFEMANGGTIFLDEVETMSQSLQVKLLRVLQDMTFFKVGSSTPVTVDVRVLAATNQDLKESVDAKQFREDLYYRLNVIKVSIPPLRERMEDIPLLVRYFVGKFNKKMGRNITKASDSFLAALMSHTWPGNVRELENCIERAVAIADTALLREEDFNPDFTANPNNLRNDLTLASMEKQHILKVLSFAEDNKTRASKLLGLDVTTLWRKLKKYSETSPT
ncbi:MAG TPA: GAF domain-containing protein [Nitrospirae bacterium]|nr:GAF domain-containing protein [Nitrospirota bacterium]